MVSSDMGGILGTVVCRELPVTALLPVFCHLPCHLPQPLLPCPAHLVQMISVHARTPHCHWVTDIVTAQQEGRVCTHCGSLGCSVDRMNGWTTSFTPHTFCRTHTHTHTAHTHLYTRVAAPHRTRTAHFAHLHTHAHTLYTHFDHTAHAFYALHYTRIPFNTAHECLPGSLWTSSHL